MKEMKEYKKGNAFAFDNFREARQWANKPGAEWERGLVLGSHIGYPYLVIESARQRRHAYS